LNRDKSEGYRLAPDLFLTKKAEEAYTIVKKSIIRAVIERVRAYFLVMGPGSGAEGFDLRVMIKELIEKEKRQVATFPEDVSVETLRGFLSSIGLDVSYLRNLIVNVTTKEYVLMLGYDITLILLMSVGAISEFSIYFTKLDVAHKIRVYHPEKFSKEPSFIRLGPLELFNRVYHHLYTFKNEEELKQKVGGLVDDYLTYLLLAKF